MYIAYIKKPNWDNITQLHDITDVKVNIKLNETWSWSFYIAYDNPWNTLEVLQEFNRCIVYKQLNTGIEKLLIEWYMKAPEADTEWTTVFLWDMNDFFKTKFVWSAKSYSWKTLDFILTDILADINWRFATWLTLDCWVADIIPNKSYSAWEDLLNIFQDLADSGYEFKVENNVLIFKSNIWIDRSISWENYLEYYFDKDDSDSRTIDNPKTTFNSENIANYIKVKNGWSLVTDSDPTSITKFWSVERFFPSSWSDALSVSWILNERKDSVREIEFIPISQDFFEVDISDTVRVIINSKNILNNYDGTVKILEKKYDSWELEKISIKVSTTKVKTFTLLEQISKIKERQKLQEL